MHVLLLYAAANITSVEITGLSPNLSFYCPNDTLVYTCESESVVPSGPDFLGWYIDQEFAGILYFPRSEGLPPPVGSAMTDPNTGAVVKLTVVEADHWVTTLTVTNPGSSFRMNPVTPRCADNIVSDELTLSALGERQRFTSVCLDERGCAAF